MTASFPCHGLCIALDENPVKVRVLNDGKSGMSLLMSAMIGHRGVASLAPENTLSGIRKAAEQGLDWIELDVTLLGDNAPVMFHDHKLNRTTSGKGHLQKHNLSSVKALGCWQLAFGSVRQ